MNDPYDDGGGGAPYGGGIPPYHPTEPARPARRPMPASGPGRAPPRTAESGARRPPPPPSGRPDYDYPRSGDGASRGQRRPPPRHAEPLLPPPPPPPPPKPATTASTEHLYDGSAYGELEDDGYPSPSAAWPLSPGGGAGGRGGGGPSGSPSPTSPRRPPKRPQRPDYQPPVLDPPRPAARAAPASRSHPPPFGPPTAHHGSGQWTGDGYSSPSQYYSRIPLPQPPHPPQQQPKRPPLGPPPSARKGPASYYPQVAPVHPIAEEAESMRGSILAASIAPARARESTKSYASSSVIPIPEYYLEPRHSAPSLPDTDRPLSGPDSVYSERSVEAPLPLHVPAGRAARHDDDGGAVAEGSDRGEPSPEPTVLVRQASLGRKSKPTLTTVKSGERMRKASSGDGIVGLPSQQRESHSPMVTASPPSSSSSSASAVASGAPAKRSRPDQEPTRRADATPPSSAHDHAFEVDPAAAASSAAKAGPSRDDSPARPGDGRGPDPGMLKPPGSDPAKTVTKMSSNEILGIPVQRPAPARTQSKSPLVQEFDPSLLGPPGRGLDGGRAPDPRETGTLRQPYPGLSERAGKRRPPRLDFDGMKEAETRGSLTSLPELIRRATKLASNLDRGKTASRMGLNWFDGAAEGDAAKHRSVASSENRRSGISDMLASFPPPGLTPLGSRTDVRRSFTNWNSNLRHSYLPSESDVDETRPRRRKRCCGMPLWLFVLLLVVVILLVAAAIIVPVMLVVVPKQNHADSSSSSTTKALSRCESRMTCQNSGVNVMTSGGSCQCVCVNGYTGPTCQTPSGAGCTTTTVGATGDATVGDAIPRLLAAGDAQFGVPLDGQTVLGLFSGADLSCHSQNALVTFNGNAERRALTRDPTPTVHNRRATAAGGSESGAATSNGIIFATGSPTMAATASSTATPSASSSPNDNNNNNDNNSTSVALDFARVAVLYVLQASDQLDPATIAQESLQAYFSNAGSRTGQPASSAANVSLGNGYSCDMNRHRIHLHNGDVVGGA